MSGHKLRLTLSNCGDLPKGHVQVEKKNYLNGQKDGGEHEQDNFVDENFGGELDVRRGDRRVPHTAHAQVDDVYDLIFVQ